LLADSQFFAVSKQETLVLDFEPDFPILSFFLDTLRTSIFFEFWLSDYYPCLLSWPVNYVLALLADAAALVILLDSSTSVLGFSAVLTWFVEIFNVSFAI
jgi:hypothetical protein